jgi:hypothetical protein
MMLFFFVCRTSNLKLIDKVLLMNVMSGNETSHKFKTVNNSEISPASKRRLKQNHHIYTTYNTAH